MDIEFIDFFTELSFLVWHFHVSIAEAKERSDPSWRGHSETQNAASEVDGAQLWAH